MTHPKKQRGQAKVKRAKYLLAEVIFACIVPPVFIILTNTGGIPID